MHEGPTSFREIVNEWPSMAVLAEDLGVTYEVVRKWRQRRSIPPDHWERLLLAARRRRVRLRAQDLIRIAAR